MATSETELKLINLRLFDPKIPGKSPSSYFLTRTYLPNAFLPEKHNRKRLARHSRNHRDKRVKKSKSARVEKRGFVLRPRLLDSLTIRLFDYSTPAVNSSKNLRRKTKFQILVVQLALKKGGGLLGPSLSLFGRWCVDLIHSHINSRFFPKFDSIRSQHDGMVDCIDF